MTDKPPPLISTELLERYPSRETKIARIRELERSLEKMEMEDEENDPMLIEGHIRLTRGYRMGCGVAFGLGALVCVRLFIEGVTWARVAAYLLAAVAIVTIARGALYRPDPKLIQAAYRPHRNTPEYNELIEELDMLARALSHDLRSGD